MLYKVYIYYKERKTERAAEDLLHCFFFTDSFFTINRAYKNKDIEWKKNKKYLEFKNKKNLKKVDAD